MEDLRPYLTMSIRDLQEKVGFKSYSQFWCIITGRTRATAENAILINKFSGIPKSVIRPDLWKPKKKAA